MFCVFLHRNTERVETLALTVLNTNDGTFSFSDYTQWLTNPQLITGALLISTGDCSLTDGLINMTISLQADSVKEICEFNIGMNTTVLAHLVVFVQTLHMLFTLCFQKKPKKQLAILPDNQPTLSLFSLDTQCRSRLQMVT